MNTMAAEPRSDQVSSIENVLPPLETEVGTMEIVSLYWRYLIVSSDKQSKNSASAVLKYFCSRYFKGDVINQVNHKLCNYVICAERLSLSDCEKAIYLVKILESPACDLFFENFSSNVSFTDSPAIMNNEIDSPNRQETLQKKLEGLRLK